MKAEQDAALAALKAAWPGGRTYNAGSVPASPQTPYQVVSVAAGTPVNYRAGSRHSSLTYRIAVQNFGKSFSEVSVAAEAADAALLDARISAAYTPCRREVASPIYRDPDGGSLLLTTHTYTTTKPV